MLNNVSRIAKHFVKAVDDLGHNVPNPVITPAVLPTINNCKVQYINNSLIVFGQRNTQVNILLEIEGDRNTFMTVNVSLQDCPTGQAYVQ